MGAEAKKAAIGIQNTAKNSLVVDIKIDTDVGSSFAHQVKQELAMCLPERAVSVRSKYVLPFAMHFIFPRHHRCKIGLSYPHARSIISLQDSLSLSVVSSLFLLALTAISESPYEAYLARAPYKTKSQQAGTR